MDEPKQKGLSIVISAITKSANSHGHHILIAHSQTTNRVCSTSFILNIYSQGSYLFITKEKQVHIIMEKRGLLHHPPSPNIW
jgi:hypothetical protein